MKFYEQLYTVGQKTGEPVQIVRLFNSELIDHNTILTVPEAQVHPAFQFEIEENHLPHPADAIFIAWTENFVIYPFRFKFHQDDEQEYIIYQKLPRNPDTFIFTDGTFNQYSIVSGLT